MPLVLLMLAASILISTPSGAASPTGAEFFRIRQDADRAYLEKRYPAAESLYAIIAGRGEDAWLWLRLGQSRARMKKYREAADGYRRALPFGTKRSAEGPLPL